MESKMTTATNPANSCLTNGGINFTNISASLFPIFLSTIFPATLAGEKSRLSETAVSAGHILVNCYGLCPVLVFYTLLSVCVLVYSGKDCSQECRRFTAVSFATAFLNFFSISTAFLLPPPFIGCINQEPEFRSLWQLFQHGL